MNDFELPGMWESADFEGGQDDDQKVYFAEDLPQGGTRWVIAPLMTESLPEQRPICSAEVDSEGWE